jgi:hypothetical protein
MGIKDGATFLVLDNGLANLFYGPLSETFDNKFNQGTLSGLRLLNIRRKSACCSFFRNLFKLLFTQHHKNIKNPKKHHSPPPNKLFIQPFLLGSDFQKLFF